MSDVILDDLRSSRPTVWVNPDRDPDFRGTIHLADIQDAAARLGRFAPFLAQVFDGPWHTDSDGHPLPGIIDSPVVEAPRMAEAVGLRHPLWIKRDDILPISGSIKARGGIYEVLATAERIALESGWAAGGVDDADYLDFGRDTLREVLGRHTIAVGSTGNLGLSVGIMARALGMQATVHMSADAREWKKAKLRGIGATVVEYEGDYGRAVEAGRAEAAADPLTHFVDDENSRLLFAGYAVAALRLATQLDRMGLTPDADHPLHVHLPCGVGGGPGGIAAGLHAVLGDAAQHVHTWYAEPVGACCMILSLATGRGDRIAISDIGLDGRTVADGLAVGRASALAYAETRRVVAGATTVADEDLFTLLRTLAKTEGIRLEPSALAGVAGASAVERAGVDLPPGARHLAWATGGSMVPAREMEAYLRG